MVLYGTVAQPYGLKLSGRKICTFRVTVFLVPWSQNEPSEGQNKNTQLTSTLRRLMGWPCFYGKLAKFNTTYG